MVKFKIFYYNIIMNKLVNNNMSKTRFIFPRRWYNDISGFESLSLFAHITKLNKIVKIEYSTIYISLAIYTAVYLIIKKEEFDGKKFRLSNHYSIYQLSTAYNLSILFRKVLPSEDLLISKDLFHYQSNENHRFKADLYKLKNYLSDNLFDDVYISLQEIFINATPRAYTLVNRDHKHTKFDIIFSYQISEKKANFVIANLGDNFEQEISSKTGISYENSFDYISKSFELGFSTRKSGNGGLGLYLVNKTIEKYRGQIIIASGSGMVIRDFRTGYKNITHDLRYRLPMSIVSIEILNEGINSNHSKEERFSLFDYFEERNENT